MPESEEHVKLVGVLQTYIADRFCGGVADRVLTDSKVTARQARPMAIGGYVPDAYLLLGASGRVVIGEAKSLRDLENLHTEAQIRAFLRRCAMVKGSVFVLAVPWPIERLAKALVSKFRANEQLLDVEMIVLSDANRLGAPSISTG